MRISIEQIYDHLSDDEDARVCKDISDKACKEVPGNFLLILTAQCLSKISDALSSSKIILPWLLSSIGAPTFFSGLLVPIRESGSLIPQLMIGGVLRRFAVRKWFFVAGCFLQAMAIAAIAWVSANIVGLLAGATITILLVMFSLARGFCSVASKDVLGKTIPKTRRGRLGGLAASIAGGFVIVLGVLILVGLVKSPDALPWLLIAASLGWLVAMLFFSGVKEDSGATEGGANAFKEALSNINLLKTDKLFCRFVIARCLLMSSGLAAPYLVVVTQHNNRSDALYVLGMFIVVSGIASLVSGFLWGKLADHSSRKVLLIAAAITACVCALAGVLSMTDEHTSLSMGVLLFLVLTVAHQGVRLGRKTYVVDLARGNRRTDYVAVSNTIIGIMLLVVGIMGATLSNITPGVALIFFSLMGCLGFIVTLNLSEA